MALDAAGRRRAIGWGVAGTLLGLLVAALPYLHKSNDNPLPEQFDRSSQAYPRIVTALRWYDHACQTGDLQGFAETVTQDHFETLQRRLQRMSRQLNGQALQELAAGSEGRGLSVLVVQCFAAGATRDATTAVVVAMDPRNPRRGALGLRLLGDGRTFLLDHKEHRPEVDPFDPELCRALAQRLLLP